MTQNQTHFGNQVNKLLITKLSITILQKNYDI